MAKSKLTKPEVIHIAQLAQLVLTKKELVEFQKQLSAILKYVDQLNQLNTNGIEPTSQVTGLENVFRPDQPTPSLSQKEVLSGAKEKHHHFFKVKAVFE